VPPKEPNTIYAATGSGGLWKSVNNGITWDPIFDDQPVISIGDIAVADTDPKIVWVGTGEHTSSRSTYWGDGVYKSVDAGKTWTNMGLKDSHHIGRMLLDPVNPNIVYVAARDTSIRPTTSAASTRRSTAARRGRSRSK
jgi:hypothetical protein